MLSSEPAGKRPCPAGMGEANRSQTVFPLWETPNEAAFKYEDIRTEFNADQSRAHFRYGWLPGDRGRADGISALTQSWQFCLPTGPVVTSISSR